MATLLLLQISFCTLHIFTIHCHQDHLHQTYGHDAKIQAPTFSCDLCAKLLLKAFDFEKFEEENHWVDFPILIALEIEKTDLLPLASTPSLRGPPLEKL